MRTDADAILALVIERAQNRLDGQARDNDAADSKALGVLGASAAAIALLVAAHDTLHPLWWIPMITLCGAVALLLVPVWPRSFDVGPDWREFYETYGEGEFSAVGRQLLSELLAAIEFNERQTDKSTFLRAGLAVLLVGLVGAALVALGR
jgi:hypothetical protein